MGNFKEKVKFYAPFFHPKNIRVEVLFFLNSFASFLEDPIHAGLMYRKVCLYMYNQSVDICDNLSNGTHKTEQEAVQRETSYWTVYDTVCFTVPGILSVMILGAWSDRFSRKLPMLIIPVGQILNCLSHLLNAVFIYGPPHYLLIGPLVRGATGGLMGFTMIIYSYVTLVSSPENRTIRMAILEAAGLFSASLSTAVSGPLLTATSYQMVFLVSIIIYVIGIMYTVVLIPALKEETPTRDTENEEDALDEMKPIPDSADLRFCSDSYTAHSPVDNDTIERDVKNVFIVSDNHSIQESSQEGVAFRKKKHYSNETQISTDKEDKENTSQTACSKLCNLENVKGTVRSCLKKRENNHRVHILVILVMLSCFMLGGGTGSIMYLFLRYPPLSMTQTQFGYFQAIQRIVPAVTLLIILPVSKKVFKVRDTILLMSGLVSRIASPILMGLSTQVWMVFLTPFIGVFGSFPMSCIRSLVSQIVDKDERGQIYAAMTAFQMGTAIANTFLYSYFLYPATISFFPGFSFMVGAAFLGLALLLAVFLHIDIAKYAKNGYTVTEEDL